MAIEYIGTDNIKVFPSAFRNGDAEAKRTTEENLIKFNRLSSSDENLEQMFTDPDDSDYVIFNIHGYWFRCLKTSIPLGNNLFAYIKLEKIGGVGWRLSAIPESALDDESDNFTGLGFDTIVPEDVKDEGELIVKYYGLKVRDENGEIIEQKLKLTSDEIRNKNTDRSIREELTTTSILVEEILAGNIVSETISATGNVQSGSITTRDITATGNITTTENITAESVQTDILEGTAGGDGLVIDAATITAATAINSPIITTDEIRVKSAGEKLIIDSSIKTTGDKSIDITGDLSIGTGGLISGTGAVTFGNNDIDIAGSVNIPASSELNLDGAATNVSTITLKGKTSSAKQAELFIADNKKITLKSDVDVDAAVDINSALTVGATSVNTGAVNIKSAGSSATTITGPAGGEAKLISGEYGEVALLDSITLNGEEIEPTARTVNVKLYDLLFGNQPFVPVTSAGATLVTGIDISDYVAIEIEWSFQSPTTRTYFAKIKLSTTGGTPFGGICFEESDRIYIRLATAIAYSDSGTNIRIGSPKIGTTIDNLDNGTIYINSIKGWYI